MVKRQSRIQRFRKSRQQKRSRQPKKETNYE